MQLPQLKAIAKQLDADLAAVFAKHGLNMTGRTASVDPTTGSVRFTITTADANLKDEAGNITTPEAERFKAYAPAFGLDPAWLGAEITMGGQTFRIAGLRDTRGAKPVIIKRVRDDKTFVCPAEDVRVRLKAAA